MANIYGIEQLERMILNETNTNAKKGLLGEKDILLMLQEQLPSHTHVIHNPILIHYEADILVIDENIGFMFLEVKTWNERFIERFFPNGNILTKSGLQNPRKQAENYRSELKSTLSSHLSNSIKQDPHQLISSSVLFNGISKEQFLRRAEVLEWEEEWKNKFLAKHFFYAGESSGFYRWMMKSRKFNRSRVSDYFSGESFDRLIDILVLDNEMKKSPMENKLPITSKVKPKKTVANVSAHVREDHLKKLKVRSNPKVKRKKKIVLFVGLLAVGIVPLIYILNDWGDNKGNYEWQEDNISDDQVFLDLQDEELPVDSQDAYDYFILADSQHSKLVETQLYGFSKSDLRIARNEIYARHGYIFKSEDLQKYFNSQTWYKPDPSYHSELTDIEQHNVTLIQSLE
ncbi:YARHG domain-containing protein [Sporosarcina sp. P7]|uniref:YARHG domain-containing protein n=1 Tax=Sporosarcina sp. P7 TaxID=2048244 RepID=UPI000C16B7F7|nr:YARHG domain-containing protein [Sporosarcina sp. P7]PID23620.1 hypothetical protein CSV60_13965 [Sporosarcina sp. P7]